MNNGVYNCNKAQIVINWRIVSCLNGKCILILSADYKRRKVECVEYII